MIDWNYNASQTVPTRQWNTTLPTQLVIGWTRVDTVTDEQIAILLYKLDGCAYTHCNDWTIDARIDAQRATVREWLEKL